MMRMTIILNDTERTALQAMASKSLRMPRDQVRYILRQELERGGFLSQETRQAQAAQTGAQQAQAGQGGAQ